MTHVLVPNPNVPGAFNDLQITVFTWKPNGTAAPNVSFDWRCRLLSISDHSRKPMSGEHQAPASISARTISPTPRISDMPHRDGTGWLGRQDLELRNVVAKYPIGKVAQIPGIQPNSGHRDYSRSSCGIGNTQLGSFIGSDGSALRRKRSPGTLDGRTRFDRIMPAFQIGIVRKSDVLHAVKVDVRVHRHVGNGIGAAKVFV